MIAQAVPDKLTKARQASPWFSAERTIFGSWLQILSGGLRRPCHCHSISPSYVAVHVIMRARVLYTKHLTKKRKTWSDGFVDVSAQRSATLSDEQGQALATARLPAGEDWAEDTEGLRLPAAYFWGLLICNLWQSQ